jgi:hypothetical protein
MDEELLIGDRSKKTLKFWFELYGGNFHICSMSGVATSIAKNKYIYTEDDCKWVLTINKTIAEIEDVGSQCQPLYCAINASIGKTAFLKKPANNSIQRIASKLAPPDFKR